MLSLFKKNTVENHFKKISIRGRLAFGVKCLEQYIKEKNLENKHLDKLISVLWDFTTSENLAEWDNKISDLHPNNIVDKHPDNKASDYKSLTESEFIDLKKYYSEISDDLFLLIDLIIDIGTTDLYGATGSYSKDTLQSTMRVYQFAQEKMNEIPNIHKFKISKFSEKSGWGNKIEKSAFY
ncbi:hypothetical protein [uncultured Aquimarina sp.]|uniref:hypothetical protein n=1 Tax=uncultured Aquimarina sp. TaxID=575652 RepID=UPI0026068633|nr:hypothetical protein [uncultured Aquimarina sp.]